MGVEKKSVKFLHLREETLRVVVVLEYLDGDREKRLVVLDHQWREVLVFEVKAVACGISVKQV